MFEGLIYKKICKENEQNKKLAFVLSLNEGKLTVKHLCVFK